jgi:NitT/TauT family transport system ATP-binding protein
MTALVEFRNVWLAYNDELLAQDHFAVEDNSLQVTEGEFIAIVWPSGCGKSTFMKLTTGLKMPSKGAVHIGGNSVAGPLNISAMAFRAPSLRPWRTILDDVRQPLEIAITLAFAGLVTIGAMAMATVELFSGVEPRTTGWAHRGSRAA